MAANHRTTSQLVWQPRAAQRQDLLQVTIKEHNPNLHQDEVQDQIPRLDMETTDTVVLVPLPRRSHNSTALAQSHKPVLPSASKSTCTQMAATSPSAASTTKKQQQSAQHENVARRNPAATRVSAPASTTMTGADIEDVEEAAISATPAHNPLRMFLLLLRCLILG